MLKTLTIHKLQDIEPTVLRFHPRRNVLLGKNGSGKTTLLRLISMVLRSDLSELAEVEFDIEFDFALANDSLVRVRISNKLRAQEEMPPDFPGASMDKKRAFEPHSVLELRTGDVVTASVRSDASRTTVVAPSTADRWKNNPDILLPPFDWRLMARRVSDHAAPSDYAAYRFDEATEIFRQIFNQESLIVYVGARGQVGGMSGHTWLPWRTWRRFQEHQFQTSQIQLRGEELPFLQPLCEQMGFAKAEYIVEIKGKRPRGPMTDISFERFRARFYWSDGSYISDGELSYGQKRLLTFLHYLACNERFVIADELVNGLHHDWIDFALQQIGDRQAFLTSQNPLLFDYLTFDSPEDVQQQFILCSAEVGTSRPKMTWRQMSREKAEEFQGAYSRGIQYVSEILQTEGLW